MLGNGNSLNLLSTCPPKNIPHLTNSVSSRCLVNYSRLLNNWGARKNESFTAAAACIRTRGYSDTSCWGKRHRTRPSHIHLNSVRVFINELLENFPCAVFPFLCVAAKSCKCGRGHGLELWFYRKCLCTAREAAPVSQLLLFLYAHIENSFALSINEFVY